MNLYSVPPPKESFIDTFESEPLEFQVYKGYRELNNGEKFPIFRLVSSTFESSSLTPEEAGEELTRSLINLD